MRKRSLLLWIGLSLATAFAHAQGIPASGPATKDFSKILGIDQKDHLGRQLPMDTPFVDESGKAVKLGDVFSKRPAFLMPMFYTCKGVCDVELHSLLQTVVKMKKTYPVGTKFDVILLSIHPKETPDLARAKKAELMEIYDLPASIGSWHLLTGTDENIHKVTDTLGFRYEYDKELDQINHPAGSMVITPTGQISSYIYGAEFYTKTLEEKLNLAAQGKVGKIEEDIVLLGCIRMNPVTHQKTLIIENFLIISGCLTVVILGGWIALMSLKYRTKPANKGGAEAYANKL